MTLLFLVSLGWPSKMSHLVLSSFAVFIAVFYPFVFLHSSLPCTWSMWRFPGYGSNQSYSCQPTPQPQPHQIWAASATYTTAHGNARSLTHWARPGIEPTSSQIRGQAHNLLSHNKGTPLIIKLITKFTYALGLEIKLMVYIFAGLVSFFLMFLGGLSFTVEN